MDRVVEYEKQQHRALAQPSFNVAAQFQYMRASVLATRDVALEAVKTGPLVAEIDPARAEVKPVEVRTAWS